MVKTRGGVTTKGKALPDHYVPRARETATDRGADVETADYEAEDPRATMDGHDDLSEEDRRKLKVLNRFHWQSDDDIRARWPYPDDLPEWEDGVPTWRGFIIVVKDMILPYLQKEWAELPPNWGRTKFWRWCKRSYISISQSMITRFLASDEAHLEWASRRSSVAIKPTITRKAGTLEVDLTVLRKKSNVPGLNTGGSLYVLTAVDRFSGYTFAAKLWTATSASIAKAMTKLKASSPFEWRVIHSDNGSEFAKDFVAWCEANSIRHIRGIPHVPQGQGQVEGRHAQLKRTLYALMEGHDGAYLGTALKKAIQSINNSSDSVRGWRPVDLARSDLPAEVAAEARARLRGKKDLALKRRQRFVKLSVGDTVKVDTLALEPSLRRLKKAGQHKGSHDRTFSSETYTISAIHARSNTVSLDEIDDRTFKRSDVMLVQRPRQRGQYVATYDDPDRAKAWADRVAQMHVDSLDDTFK